MTGKLESAERALHRARMIADDLERTSDPAALRQARAGLKLELETALRSLRSLRQAADGNMPGKVRTDAPATSRAAARRVTLRTGTARWRVLEYIYRNPDCTDKELQRRLALNPSTERPRRGELVDAGLVTASGTTTLDGENWTQWRCTAAGRDLAGQRTGLPDPLRDVPGEQLSIMNG